MKEHLFMTIILDFWLGFVIYGIISALICILFKPNMPVVLLTVAIWTIVWLIFFVNKFFQARLESKKAEMRCAALLS